MTPVTLTSPAQPFNTYSVPWEPGYTSKGTTVAESPAAGSEVVDPATGQTGTWLDSQPYGDGVELDTWQWPPTGSYVSPFDNAQGTGTSSSGGSITNNDGLSSAAGYPLTITTPLLYPPGSPAGTPGTVESFTSPDLRATTSGAPGDPQVTFATMPLRTNVLLPPGYSANPNTSYPVLYLLPGLDSESGFSYYLWMGQGESGGVSQGPDVEQDLVASAKAGHPMIVVMTDDPTSAANTNWYGLDSQQAPTAGGAAENDPDDAAGFEPAPQWESYFLLQVVPFIEKQYRVETSGSGQFIAGISGGGGAATSYVSAVDADQHSGSGPYRNLAFGAAGSFSGADDWLTPGLDGDFPSYVAALYNGYWSGSESGTVPNAKSTLDGPDAECAKGSGSTTNPAGNPSEVGAVWEPNDPVFQAEAWPDSQTRMFLTSGEGNAINIFNFAQIVEYYVGTMTENFAAALDGNTSPEDIIDRTWTQYNTGFLDNSGGTPTGQATVFGLGPANNCAYHAGQNCVNLYSGGSHSPAYWIPDLASFFNWLQPQANTATW